MSVNHGLGGKETAKRWDSTLSNQQHHQWIGGIAQ
jgi:hypothetical protein